MAFAALIAFGATTPSASGREFRAADNQAPDYPTVQAIEYMGEIVRRRTSGRHSIRVFHSGQLGEENETIRQTQVGAIDINRLNVAPLTQIVPELDILALPFLFDSVQHLYRVLDGEVGQGILVKLENYGFVGLAFYDSGARSFYTHKPVRSIADLKGMRIRVQNSQLAQDMVRALGATPVVIAYGQVSTGLATGLVDGAENNWPSYVTTNHYKLATNYILTEHTMAPELLVMSQQAWAQLDPEERIIFREAARDSTMFMREQWRSWENTSRTEAVSVGNVIVSDFDRKPFVAAMNDIYKKAESDPKLAPLIALIRAAR